MHKHLLCFVIHHAAKAVRITGKRLLPCRAANAPEQHIIFQLIAFICCQPGKTGLQIGKHILISPAACNGTQCRADQREHRFLQNIMLFAQKHRNIIAVKYQLQNGRILLKIARRHNNITPSGVCFAQQLPDIRRGKFTLGK